MSSHDAAQRQSEQGRSGEKRGGWVALGLEIAAEMRFLSRGPHGMAPGSFKTFSPLLKGEQGKIRYLARRAAGLCGLCDAASLPGKSTCAKHVAKNDPGRYARRRAEGLCGQCGAPSEKSRCAACLEKFNKSRKSHAATNTVTT